MKASIAGTISADYQNKRYLVCEVKSKPGVFIESHGKFMTCFACTGLRRIAEAYSKPGRMRAAWAYFASWPQLAKDFAQLSQTKLTVPVLSIGGEKSLGNELAEQMKLVATDVTVVVLKDTGHWILEERPKETTDALVKFL